MNVYVYNATMPFFAHNNCIIFVFCNNKKQSEHRGKCLLSHGNLHNEMMKINTTLFYPCAVVWYVMTLCETSKQTTTNEFTRKKLKSCEMIISNFFSLSEPVSIQPDKFFSMSQSKTFFCYL